MDLGLPGEQHLPCPNRLFLERLQVIVQRQDRGPGAKLSWTLDERKQLQLLAEIEEAVALLGAAAYLVDAGGHPFKRATMDETDGLPVVTGIRRDQYLAARPIAEAALREALALGDLQIVHLEEVSPADERARVAGRRPFAPRAI